MSLKDHWQSRRDANISARDNGQVLIGRVRAGMAMRVQVTAPANSEFNIGARELSGKWRDRTKVWSFNINSYRLVLELCNRIYGKDKVTIQ